MQLAHEEIWKFPRLSDQVEPALRGLRQAVRENRVNCEDLVPLTEEARQSYLTSGFPTTRPSYVQTCPNYHHISRFSLGIG